MDRANRLLSMGGHAYAYDGLGNRVSQTVSSIMTRYLLDVQPGLVQVMAQTLKAISIPHVESTRHKTPRTIGCIPCKMASAR